jgi:hypothetical protein
MLQLINHDSEDKALGFDFFPNCFGEFSKIRYWVESNKTYGQRFCYRVLDPHRNVWTKAKESKYADLVFMFQKHTGMVMEQVIHLNKLSDEEILYIVSYYHVTPFQKAAIQAFLVSVHSPVRTVWRDPENVFMDIEPLVYDIHQASHRPQADLEIAQAVVTSEQSARDAKRAKLHDKEALELEPARRDFYYEMLGKRNPDNIPDAQLDRM